MSNTLKFGVIGAGYMGKAYAIALNTIASAFFAAAASELVAISSNTGGRRGEEG